MITLKKHIALISLAVVGMTGCSSTASRQAAGDEGAKRQETALVTPAVKFDGDSAYHYAAVQCAFGPRVPNTDAHVACGDWLAAELRRHGAQVTEQHADLKAFDGTMLKARNIIGEFYPEKTNRILLVAHWDCRPWADNDPDRKKQREPVPGANDGASGVAVLLEVARVLSANEPEAGIDILFIDAEDWGGSEDEDSWALGTQYWTANPHRKGYRYPSFGILLDMVGDRDAVFMREYFSTTYAEGVVDRIWQTARSLGYGDKFSDYPGAAMTDDHVYLIRAGIPCVDIIDQRRDTPTGFCPQWHTTDDTMRHINAGTLEAVGQTVVTMLFGR